MIHRIQCPKCGEMLRVPEQVAAHPEEIRCHMTNTTNNVKALRDTEAFLRDAGDEDSVRGADAIRAVLADRDALLDSLRFIATSDERDEDAEDTPAYLRDLARRAIAKSERDAR